MLIEAIRTYFQRAEEKSRQLREDYQNKGESKRVNEMVRKVKLVTALKILNFNLDFPPSLPMLEYVTGLTKSDIIKLVTKYQLKEKMGLTVKTSKGLDLLGLKKGLKFEERRFGMGRGNPKFKYDTISSYKHYAIDKTLLKSNKLKRSGEILKESLKILEKGNPELAGHLVDEIPKAERELQMELIASQRPWLRDPVLFNLLIKDRNKIIYAILDVWDKALTLNDINISTHVKEEIRKLINEAKKLGSSLNQHTTEKIIDERLEALYKNLILKTTI